MRYRACLAMLSAVLLSSIGFAQATSRFDLTGNASLGDLKFVGAPSGSQVRAIGWQTSGTSHFNRWLGFTSQFSGGYANAQSIQLVGFSGAGTVQHYAWLVGPRITFVSRSRFRPFIEGLGGTDYAQTRFTSNGTLVKGRDLQSAYSIGGGTQINISRRVGLNIEAHYFETQHSVQFLGWTPSHLQLSAGLVFRLSNLRDRRMVADEQPSAPSTTNDTQTALNDSRNVTPEPVAPAPVTTMVVTASSETAAQQTVIRIPIQSELVPQQPVAPPVAIVPPVVATVPPINELPVMKVQPLAAAPPIAVVAPVVKAPPINEPPVVKVQPVAAAPPVAVVAPVVAKALPVSEPPVVKVQPVATAAVVSAVPQSHPVQVQAQKTQPPRPQPAAAHPTVSSSPAPAPTVAQTQPQYAAPLSLGEYARRLREKKQRQQ